MPDLKRFENLPDILRFNHWIIPDPGPPWLFELLDKEQLTAVAASHLQMQKEVMTALSAGIDRQLAIIGRQTKR